MTVEEAARLTRIEQQLDVVINYLQVVSEHLGLRARVSDYDAKLETLKPVKRESFPDAKTDPNGLKNGE